MGEHSWNTQKSAIFGISTSPSTFGGGGGRGTHGGACVVRGENTVLGSLIFSAAQSHRYKHVTLPMIAFACRRRRIFS